MKFFLLGGRRKSARRDYDKKRFIYVDQYRSWLLIAIMLLAILSLSDGLFTLHLIERGATEENPVMAWFLKLGGWPFMTAKFLLTFFGILILYAYSRPCSLARLRAWWQGEPEPARSRV